MLLFALHVNFATMASTDECAEPWGSPREVHGYKEATTLNPTPQMEYFISIQLYWRIIATRSSPPPCPHYTIISESPLSPAWGECTSIQHPPWRVYDLTVTSTSVSPTHLQAVNSTTSHITTRLHIRVDVSILFTSSFIAPTQTLPLFLGCQAKTGDDDKGSGSNKWETIWSDARRRHMMPGR